MTVRIKSNIADKWREHRRVWSGCQSCDLCQTRTNVVLCRGQLPADIFFLGEAPGDVEDSRGQPFIGPAGDQLNAMIEEADLTGRMAFGNIVACIPRAPSDTGTGPIRQPSKEEASTCQPRLLELLQLAKPKVIVCLGQVAKRFLPPVCSTIQIVEVIHPAAILYQDDAKQKLSIKRFVSKLKGIKIER